jgi:hypothetical protein
VLVNPRVNRRVNPRVNRRVNACGRLAETRACVRRHVAVRVGRARRRRVAERRAERRDVRVRATRTALRHSCETDGLLGEKQRTGAALH